MEDVIRCYANLARKSSVHRHKVGGAVADLAAAKSLATDLVSVEARPV